ncbi:MAG: hypothetical protein ABIQ30_11805 [Devosia sp.]
MRVIAISMNGLNDKVDHLTMAFLANPQIVGLDRLAGLGCFCSSRT